MNRLPIWALATVIPLLLAASATAAPTTDAAASDADIAGQNAALTRGTVGMGFGPQSPRDIEAVEGANTRTFGAAPPREAMNLCNIHFHESAEHRGGEFTTYRGNGDGRGHGTGFVYSGELGAAELAPVEKAIGAGQNGGLVPGDTIEVHYVYSTSQVVPGPTLNSCFNDRVANPQLRVEAQVYVLVNDTDALDFADLTAIVELDGLQQVPGIPSDTGEPVQYRGSTTGPDYNEKASLYQVTWNVRPQVAKVDILTVGDWLGNNVFDEEHAHGARNIVTDPDLLSTISN